MEWEVPEVTVGHMRWILGSCCSCLVPSFRPRDAETSASFLPPQAHAWSGGRAVCHGCGSWCCQLQINTTKTDPENYFLLMEKLSGPEQSDLRAFRCAQRNILESSLKLLSALHCPSTENSSSPRNHLLLDSLLGRAHTTGFPGLKTIASHRSWIDECFGSWGGKLESKAIVSK